VSLADGYVRDALVERNYQGRTDRVKVDDRGGGSDAGDRLHIVVEERSRDKRGMDGIGCWPEPW